MCPASAFEDALLGKLKYIWCVLYCLRILSIGKPSYLVAYLVTVLFMFSWSTLKTEHQQDRHQDRQQSKNLYTINNKPYTWWVGKWYVQYVLCVWLIMFPVARKHISVTGPGVLPWRDLSTSRGILRFLACSFKVQAFITYSAAISLHE